MEPLTVRSPRFSGPLADHSAEPSNAGPPDRSRTCALPAFEARSSSSELREDKFVAAVMARSRWTFAASIYGSISVSLERPEVGIQHESRMRLHVDLLFA